MASKHPSEAWSAPLLSPVQQGIFVELRTVCETAAIEGASLGDIRAAANVLAEHAATAFDAAAMDTASDAMGIRYADEDDDADGPDGVWKPRPA